MISTLRLRSPGCDRSWLSFGKFMENGKWCWKLYSTSNTWHQPPMRGLTSRSTPTCPSRSRSSMTKGKCVRFLHPAPCTLHKGGTMPGSRQLREAPDQREVPAGAYYRRGSRRRPFRGEDWPPHRGKRCVEPHKCATYRLQSLAGVDVLASKVNVSLGRALKTIARYKISSQATAALRDDCVRMKIEPLCVLQDVLTRWTSVGRLLHQKPAIHEHEYMDDALTEVLSKLD